MEHRAYSLLTVKAIDEDKGIIRGIATTPTPDRMGDVVEPKGAEFSLPIPLLWQHDSGSPIGSVTEAKVTKAGIEIVATVARGVSEEIDKAWALIKAGLVRGLSIGFRGLDIEQIPNSWGVKFLRWEWLELSAVTIPANAEASITTLKSIVSEQRAASGRSETPPAASGDSPKRVARKENPMAQKKSLADRIADWEHTKSTKIARMDEIQEAAEAEGRTKDAAEREEYETLKDEVAEIEKEIGDLRARERLVVSAARAVDADPRAVETRGTVPATVKAPKPEPGIRMARYVRCQGLAHKMHKDVTAIAEELYGTRDPDFVAYIKAAGALTPAVTSANEAALIGNEGGFADFVDYLRPRTIIGRFGMGGIPSVRRIPFRVPLISQDGAGVAYWTAEGKAKPVTKPSFERVELAPLKVAAITAVTMEQLRDSSPSAEVLIRDDLARAIAQTADATFIGGAAGGTGYPAGITYNLTGGQSNAGTGETADAVYTDVATAMGVFAAANNDLTQGVWIMSAVRALRLSLMRNELGQPEFPGITMNGGTFMGLPVITSQAASADVTLMNASDVWLAEEGGITVDMSTEASLEMRAGDDEGPTLNIGSAPPVAASLVSLWQTNAAAFRAEWTVNWARRRPTAFAVVEDAIWGDPTSA